MRFALFSAPLVLALIFAILTACGFFMSFQFTAYNTVAYAEIEKSQLSDATSLYTTLQQLMLSLGICTGAAALQIALSLQGHAKPSLGDFSIAFFTVTAISLTASYGTGALPPMPAPRSAAIPPAPGHCARHCGRCAG